MGARVGGDGLTEDAQKETINPKLHSHSAKGEIWIWSRKEGFCSEMKKTRC